jgi:flagellar biosynthesis chaperone FliJ
MSRPGGSFRYSLEMLLKQRRWEQDLSAVQERTARGVLEAHREAAHGAEGAVARVESALREARRAGVPIDPRQHESASLYLAQVREALRAKARQATKAEEVHEQTRHSLLRSVQAVRALEQHREDRRREHKRERQSLAQQKQDELWLTGRRSSWR